MKRKYILLLDAGILALIPVAVLLAKWMLKALPDCMFMRVGVLCPACGGTRCLIQLARGNFLQALQLNPYFFFTAWLVLGLLVLAYVAFPFDLFPGPVDDLVLVLISILGSRWKNHGD